MTDDEAVRIIRSDDPEHDALVAAGWTVQSTSWGARLQLDDDRMQQLRALVRAHLEHGVEVEELTPADAPFVAALERVTFADYPQTAATAHEAPGEEEAAALFVDGRVFGVRRDGALVAVTATVPEEDLVETSFTSVHPGHRRQGLAAPASTRAAGR